MSASSPPHTGSNTPLERLIAALTLHPGAATIPTSSAAPGPVGAMTGHDPARLEEMSGLAGTDGQDQPTSTWWGASVPQPTGRVYGGQVLAQSLLAAAHTIPDGRLPHSMHGYFLRPGNAQAPIGFDVEKLRDGRSFSARRTQAFQGQAPILSMIASFQLNQPGLDRAVSKPSVPPPDQVPSALETLGGIPEPLAQFWSTDNPFELRHVEGSLYLQPATVHQARQRVWMRARGSIDGSPLLHRALLAYACDQVMLEPVMRNSGLSWSTPGLSLASLDHALWWHRDVRVDQWLLYAEESPSSQGGRGLTTAHIFTESGTLVATVAQEGMVRVPETQAER